MEKIKNSSAYPIIYMIILSFILVFLLAGLNELTKERTSLNRKLELQAKILDVFQIQADSEEGEDILSSFENNIEVSEFESDPLYIFKDQGQVQAYAVPFEGPGLWGGIKGYIGLSADMETITGIQFIEQSETPGLGARIEEEEYRDQYRGIDISQAPAGEYIRSTGQANVDIISGATQTTHAVEDMVNEDLAHFIESYGGE